MSPKYSPEAGSGSLAPRPRAGVLVQGVTSSTYQQKDETLLWLLVSSQSFPSPRHLTTARRAVWSTIAYLLFAIDLQAGRSAIRHLPTRPMADASCSGSGGQPTQTDPNALGAVPPNLSIKAGQTWGWGAQLRFVPPPPPSTIR